MSQNILVPPARFGALLAKQRRQANVSVAEVASSSASRFTVQDLEQIEQGRAVLDETLLAAVSSLYEIHTSPIVPQRNSLVIDLVDKNVSVGDRNITFQDTSIETILERYLSLLYLLRNQTPGTHVTLRQPDLLVLEQALRLPIPRIETVIAELTPKHGVKERTSSLKKRLIVPGAGILVSLTALGSLVMLNGEYASSQTLSTPQETKPAILIEAPSTSNQKSISTLSDQTPRDLTFADRGARAEKLINYDFEQKLPGWTIVYKGDRRGYRGLTNVPEKTIEIYIDHTDTPFSIAGVLAHELGHAIDVTYLDHDARSQWLAARNLPKVWWPGNGLSDFHVGAGDFAEAVAVVLSNSPSDSEHGDFTVEQLDLARQLLP